MQKQAVTDRTSPIERSIAISMWGFVGFICLCLVSQWVTINRRDQVFADYANRVIQLAAKEQNGAKDVRAWLLLKAADLSMTIPPEEVHVTGQGPSLRATVRYFADVSMPVVNKPVYRVSFHHDLALQ